MLVRKFRILVLFIFLSASSLFAQWDPILEYETHKFLCDSGQTTIEITFCWGEKNTFADSLLNKLYKLILQDIDKDIRELRSDFARMQKKVKKSADDSLQMELNKTELDRTLRSKAALKESQRAWLKLRQANSNYVIIDCEGGRECNAIDLMCDTEEILERIKKLKKLAHYY